MRNSHPGIVASTGTMPGMLVRCSSRVSSRDVGLSVTPAAELMAHPAASETRTPTRATSTARLKFRLATRATKSCRSAMSRQNMAPMLTTLNRYSARQ